MMGTTLKSADSNEPSRSEISKKGVKHRNCGSSTDQTDSTVITLPTNPSDEIVSSRDEDDWGSHNSAGSRSRMYHEGDFRPRSP